MRQAAVLPSGQQASSADQLEDRQISADTRFNIVSSNGGSAMPAPPRHTLSPLTRRLWPGAVRGAAGAADLEAVAGDAARCQMADAARSALADFGNRTRQRRDCRCHQIALAVAGTENPRVLLLAFAYVPIPLAIYGLSLWLPTLVKAFNASDFTTGVLSAYRSCSASSVC